VHATAAGLERTRGSCPLALPRATKAEARGPKRTGCYGNLASFIGSAYAPKGECAPSAGTPHRCAGDIHGRGCTVGGECLHPKQDNPPNREELESGNSRSESLLPPAVIRGTIKMPIDLKLTPEQRQLRSSALP
jgi:hypothetical protein